MMEHVWFVFRGVMFFFRVKLLFFFPWACVDNFIVYSNSLKPIGGRFGVIMGVLGKFMHSWHCRDHKGELVAERRADCIQLYGRDKRCWSLFLFSI